MIPARKNRLGGWAVRQLIRRSLRGMFRDVYLHMESPAPHGDDPIPLICYAAHTSWWDGYMASLLSEDLWKLDGYLMMDERQLQRYRFFTWAGCFSIERSSLSAIRESLDYTIQLLTAWPGRVVWIFPQGQIMPNDRRPLHLARGTSHIAAALPCVTLRPVALRYEFRGEQRPEAFAWVGEPHTSGSDGGPVEPKALTAEMTNRLTQAMDTLRDHLLQNDLSPFTCVLQGTVSVNRRFDALLGRKQIPPHDREN